MRWLLLALTLMLSGLLFASDSAAGAGTGDISGRIFLDLNENGQFDGADIPVSGETIRATGPQFLQVPTNGDGTFLLSDLMPGDYTVAPESLPCADYLHNNWVGEYIQGWCPTNAPAPVNVTVTDGGTASALIAIAGVPGRLGGRLWLDGEAAPDGTPITARAGDTTCAEGQARRTRLGSGVTVADFELIFPAAPSDPTCEGASISLFAGDRMFAQTSRLAIWSHSLMSWQYSTGFFSNADYALPLVFGLSAATNVAPPFSVRAVIGGHLCGGASSSGGDIYGLIILSDDIRLGCGVNNTPVTICLGNRATTEQRAWVAELGQFWAVNLEAGAEPCPIPARIGDGDCDGNVTLADIVLQLKAFAGIATSVPCSADADTNCDGQLALTDAIPVLSFLASDPLPGQGNCPAVGQTNA